MAKIRMQMEHVVGLTLPSGNTVVMPVVQKNKQNVVALFANEVITIWESRKVVWRGKRGQMRCAKI